MCVLSVHLQQYAVLEVMTRVYGKTENSAPA